jgi:hypothetical protein
MKSYLKQCLIIVWLDVIIFQDLVVLENLINIVKNDKLFYAFGSNIFFCEHTSCVLIRKNLFCFALLLSNLKSLLLTHGCLELETYEFRFISTKFVFHI